MYSSQLQSIKNKILRNKFLQLYFNDLTEKSICNNSKEINFHAPPCNLNTLSMILRWFHPSKKRAKKNAKMQEERFYIHFVPLQLLALRQLMQGDKDHPNAPLGNNFRPPQPLHHRPVRTNIDFNVQVKNLIRAFWTSR